MNLVHMMGRAVADPEMKTTQAGNLIARFTIAVDKRLSKQQREEFVRENKSTADFFKVVAWGGTAEILERYLKKGARIAVLGNITTNSFEKAGDKVYTTEIHAERIHIIDLPPRNEAMKTEGETKKRKRSGGGLEKKVEESCLNDIGVEEFGMTSEMLETGLFEEVEM